MSKQLLRKIAASVLSVALAFGSAPALATPQEEPHALEVAATGHWRQSGSRWWFEFSDGTYAHSGYYTVNGTTYAFDGEGWMVVGWKLWGDGTWCYAYPSGALANDWALIGGKWFHFTENDMDTGWFTDGSGVYYLGDNGDMAVGWRKIGNDWYYFQGSGRRATGWVLSGGNWYHFTSAGVMQTGKQEIDGETYFLEDEEGVTEYPLGAMYHSQWITWIGTNKRSYFQASGIMARNMWMGQFWIDADGLADTW